MSDICSKPNTTIIVTLTNLFQNLELVKSETALETSAGSSRIQNLLLKTKNILTCGHKRMSTSCNKFDLLTKMKCFF